METGSHKLQSILDEAPPPFDAESARASVLVVDDEPFVRDIVSRYLAPHGHRVRQASGVNHAREEIRRERPDVVFLDINMPGSSGFELLEELAPRWPEIAVVMATANGDIATAMRAIREGAADYITKPLDCETIRFVLTRTLERRHMYLMNSYYQVRLEDLVEKRTEELRKRTCELINTQDALVRGLCRLTEFRDHGTGEHLDRMSGYAREIARRLMKTHPELPSSFPELIHMAAPLHDIGKVGIPDAILLKPGPLTDEERAVMRTHTVIGADTLAHIRKTIAGADVPFIVMAQDICLGHHEQWCGAGYPNGWVEKRTPLAARIASVADYLDACLSPRPYRPQGMDFDTVIGNIAANSGTMFDPDVVNALMAEKEALRRVTI